MNIYRFWESGEREKKSRMGLLTHPEGGLYGAPVRRPGRAGNGQLTGIAGREFWQKNLRRMQESVKGKQLDVGDALRVHVGDRLSREGHRHWVAVADRIGRGMQIRAKGAALLHRDLSERPASMFRNAARGGLSMIYRRQDGNIGWIDPRGNLGQ